MVKIGIVGLGYFGELHLQKYLLFHNVNVVGIYDTNPERANYIADKYNVRAFDDYQSLAMVPDAVDITTPDEFHFEIAKDALERGCHTFIEKPITRSIEEADELIQIAKKKKLVLQVGHIERFNPQFIYLINRITKERFDFASVHTYRTIPFPKNRDITGSVVIDLMIHDINLVQFMIDSKIEEVVAVGNNSVTDTIDIANVEIRFYNGQKAYLFVNRNCPVKNRMITLYGYSKDSIELSLDTPYDILFDELNSFLFSIKHGIRPVVSGRDGRESLKIALEIEKEIYRKDL